MKGGNPSRNQGELFPARKHPAHISPIEDICPLIVFVTVCTKQRRPILANEGIHELIRSSWLEAKLWNVGRYVIMPDHIHLFAAPAVRPIEALRKWTSFWKSHASRHWPRHAEQPIWQADVWDTQLRTGESYSTKWEYVRNNPVRAGLVSNPDEWPYQGEISVLPWLG